jgi:hypothetical protein
MGLLHLFKITGVKLIKFRYVILIIFIVYNLMSAISITFMLLLKAKISEENICMWGIRNAEL